MSTYHSRTTSKDITDTIKYFTDHPIEGVIGVLLAIGFLAGFILIFKGVTKDKKTDKVSFDTKKSISGFVLLGLSILGIIGLAYYSHKYSSKQA